MSAAQECDDDFMSLLSTQREILKRMSKEKTSCLDGCNELKLNAAGSTKNFGLASTKHGQFDNVSDPYYLMNEPIIEQRLVRDDFRHRNSSLRISGGFDLVSTCNSQTSTNCTDYRRKHKRAKMTHKKSFRVNELSAERSSSARYDRGRGMHDNALAFNVDLTTVKTSARIDPHDPKLLKIDFHLNTSKQGATRVERLDSNLHLATLRSEFENFVRAMEKSMKSQQDIHDWDRRMGLKRSHSKTMRLSMRSRNKLRKAINV